MGDANIFISNGTCYSAAGEKLDESFIPCGNAAFGHQTCCGAGDNCLGDKACFGIHGTGYGSYLTYFGGCTDPDYKDGACPDKKGIDQPWVGLTLCDNTDGVWAACSQEGNPSTLQPGSYCSCTDEAKATVAFTDANTLPNTASLPQATGSSVQFFAGYVPTPPGTTVKETTTAPPPPPLSSKQPPPPPTTPSSPRPPPPPPPNEETSTGDSGEPTTPIPTPASTPPIEESQSLIPTESASPSSGSNGPSPTSGQGSGTASNTSPGSSPDSTNSGSPGSDPSTSETPSSGGLSAGAKAGIGVGAAAAVLIFLAVIVALVLHHRRKKRAAAAAARDEDDIAPDMAHTEHGVGGVGGGVAAGKAASSRKHDSMEHPPSDISEADGQPARPWSMRSELEGSAPGMAGAAGAAPGTRTSHELNGVGGEQQHHDEGALSPIAELPGSTPLGRPSHDGRRRVVVGDSVVYL
ncbi:hypothetical protein QBC37DRAFT_424856 [Rhypophila decipiens]|uniref:Uncharacterized protein n=1 Tax=Rhypophila decipiens TaxID=261697 RepID=A0AAN6Y4H3_9PEZI|nr:hypothetical protein QBC37DRAFT_424856 [Rhypophila decipiens]